MLKRLFSANVLVALMLMCVPSWAVVYVNASSPGPIHDGTTWGTAYQKIQDAVNAISADDEIWVAAGTYTETINLKSTVSIYGGFAGTETSLSQRDWNSNISTIDANSAGSAVTVPEGSTTDTVIDGFTITNGSGSNYPDPTYVMQPTNGGGGIYCVNASCTIRNNTIIANTAYRGAGILCVSGSPVITNNKIISNSTKGNFSQGGGIYCYDASATITDNIISKNTSLEDGGGIFCNKSSLSSISANTVSDNTAYVGGGIYCTYSSFVISNNNIIGNKGTSSTGGLYSDYSSPIVMNNLIKANVGGGLYFIQGTPTIVGNTVVCNTAGVRYYTYFGASSGITIANNTIAYNGAEGLAFSYASPNISNNIIAYNGTDVKLTNNSNPAFKNNCFYGNTSKLFRVTGSTLADGNIVADPMFASVAYGNWHIQSTSPCRNAGLNSVVQSGWIDVDGQARIEGSAVDIGSDESDGTVWPSSPKVVFVSPNGSDANDGFTWLNPKRNIQSAVNTLLLGGGEVWVKAGDYSESVSILPGISLYGGFAGSETRKDQRDSANVTTLHIDSDGSVISVKGCSNTACVDSFRIDNCRTGISLDTSSATISNNLISNCATGIRCAGVGSPTISCNSISGGSTGVYADSNSSPTIITNKITGCRGSCVRGSNANLILLANTISDGLSYGVELYCDAVIKNNAIARNALNAIYCHGPSLIVCNNSIVKNGAGVFCASTATPQIGNNIIAHNKGVAITVGCGGYSVNNNCIYDNTKDYVGLTSGFNDISSDPMMVDYANGDYHLLPGSPCIDAGGGMVSLSSDMEGNPRLGDGNSDGISVVDIGCYEAPSGYVSLIAAKNIANGFPVGLTDVIVTASLPGRVYVETPDRITGIGVVWDSKVPIGKRVTIEGTIGTLDGERVILPYTIKENGTAAVPAPWYMNFNAIGGGPIGLQAGVSGYRTVKIVDEFGNPSVERNLVDYSGVNNIGLLIRLSGKVTLVEEPFCYINGGAEYEDGSYRGKGVRVLLYDGFKPKVGDNVVVTGISSCFRICGTENSIARMIRPISLEIY